MINKMEDSNKRAKRLLVACMQLLEKQEQSPFVLNTLEEIIHYDDCDCDGYCLLEDIREFLELEV